ncbi:MAG: type VI secretion system baseplate subunit TssE [Candidatus Kapaibacterium sp.]
MASNKDNIAASLFDRLIDDDPLESSEPRPRRVVTRREFRDSVRAELMRLFNSRSDIRHYDPAPGGMTVLNYGLPDFSSFFPASQEHQRMLTDEIVRSITAFEPRLRRVRAHVTGSPRAGTLSIAIEAVLMAGSEPEPVSFPLLISDRDLVVEVNSGE